MSSSESPPHALLLFSPKTGLAMSSLSTSPSTKVLPPSSAGHYCQLLRLANTLPSATANVATTSATITIEIVTTDNDVDGVTVKHYEDTGVVLRQKLEPDAAE